jgi:hypothetical protein
MRYRLLRLISIGLAAMLVFIAVAYLFFWHQLDSAAQNTNATTNQTPPIKVGTPSPVIDQLTQQVLTNMHLHAWNPGAMTRGVVTGGLYINWKMDDPAVTNAVRPGPDGNPQHNHDIQVDLLYLTALAEYHAIHPLDHTYVQDIAHMTSVVIADFHVYSLPKGWIYFYILQDGLLLNNSTLVQEAHSIAVNYYIHWYDPTVGVVYDRTHHPGDYSTNDSLECGAALIEAGQRWKQVDWVIAGKKTIDHVLAVGLNRHYQLFYDSLTVNPHGQDTVENYQAKPGTQGESVDALVTAYELTHNREYLDVAGQVLHSLFGSSGLWDQPRGGFFFARELNTGKLLTGYKETRSQTITLIGLHHFNQVTRQSMSLQERQLIAVIATHFYQGTYHGFFYRVTPDFKIYVSRPGAGIGVEDYFSTEAIGSSLVALQLTERVQ